MGRHRKSIKDLDDDDLYRSLTVHGSDPAARHGLVPTCMLRAVCASLCVDDGNFILLSLLKHSYTRYLIHQNRSDNPA